MIPHRCQAYQRLELTLLNVGKGYGRNQEKGKVSVGQQNPALGSLIWHSGYLI